MTRHKSFQSRQEKKEELTFDIDGEIFTCKPEISGTVILEFLSLLVSDNPSISLTALLSFFKEALGPNEYARFDAFVKEPDRIVSIETLGQIFEFLVGEYAGRPFQQPSASDSGPLKTGPISMDGSELPAPIQNSSQPDLSSTSSTP